MMKNVKKASIRSAQRIRKLEIRLMDQQAEKAKRLLQSAYFKKAIAQFRKEFLSLGLGVEGFTGQAQKENWLSGLDPKIRENFTKELQNTVTLILIEKGYPNSWRQFIEDYIFYNIFKPPRYNCEIEKKYDEKNNLWNYKILISGYNTAPSATELNLIRLALEDDLSWRRKQYFTVKEFAEKEVHNMLERKKRYKFTGKTDGDPRSYKEISAKCEEKYGISISEAALKKLKSRSTQLKK